MQNCHLTSLSINLNDDVVIVPVSYGYMMEVNSLCYGSNKSCNVSWVPLFAKFKGYGVGGIEFSEESSNSAKMFLKNVNKCLLNNQKNRKVASIRPYSFENKFFIFNDENNNILEENEYTRPSDYINFSNDDSKFFKTEKIKSVNELFHLINNGSLINIKNDSPSTISYIMIKKSVYDAMLLNKYKDHFNQVKMDVMKLIETEYNPEKFEYISEYTLSERLKFFNNHNSLIYNISKIIDEIIESNDKSDDMIKIKMDLSKSLAHWSVIDHLYRSTSKSYYPNKTRPKNMKILHSLTSIINKQI